MIYQGSRRGIVIVQTWHAASRVLLRRLRVKPAMTSGNVVMQFTELHNFYIIYIFKGRYVNSENFEIMSPPQKYFDYICGVFQNEMDMTKEAEYIRKARDEYDAYSGTEWTKVGFDEHSGGYWIYHKEHRFDPTLGIFGIPRGDYERISSEALMNYGMRIVLGSEEQDGKDWEKKPDGLLNEKIFEIKGVEGTGKENILKDIKDASKKGAEIVVFYYHKKSLFNDNLIRENYHSYLRNSKSKRVQQIYYIIDKKLYTL